MVLNSPQMRLGPGRKKRCEIGFYSIRETNGNAVCVSFNGKFHDECLNEGWFTDIKHAKEGIEEWLKDYNTARPHRALGHLTPKEFAQFLNKKVSLDVVQQNGAGQFIRI
jgi:transposase InsO family protein